MEMDHDFVDERGLKMFACTTWTVSSRKRNFPLLNDFSYGTNSFMAVSGDEGDDGAAIWIGKLCSTTVSRPQHLWRCAGLSRMEVQPILFQSMARRLLISSVQKWSRPLKDAVSMDCVIINFSAFNQVKGTPCNSTKLIICEFSLAHINSAQ